VVFALLNVPEPAPASTARHKWRDMQPRRV
jgi:hypothetical protein